MSSSGTGAGTGGRGGGTAGSGAGGGRGSTCAGAGQGGETGGETGTGQQGQQPPVVVANKTMKLPWNLPEFDGSHISSYLARYELLAEDCNLDGATKVRRFSKRNDKHNPNQLWIHLSPSSYRPLK